MPNSRKVYIVNEGNKNYSQLQEWGKPVSVTKGFVELEQSDLEGLCNHIRQSITDSNINDYVMLSGPAVLVYLFCCVWFEYHTQMKVLQWKGNKYKEIIIPEAL